MLKPFRVLARTIENLRKFGFTRDSGRGGPNFSGGKCTLSYKVFSWKIKYIFFEISNDFKHCVWF